MKEYQGMSAEELDEAGRGYGSGCLYVSFAFIVISCFAIYNLVSWLLE